MTTSRAGADVPAPIIKATAKGSMRIGCLHQFGSRVNPRGGDSSMTQVEAPTVQENANMRWTLFDDSSGLLWCIQNRPVLQTSDLSLVTKKNSDPIKRCRIPCEPSLISRKPTSRRPHILTSGGKFTAPVEGAHRWITPSSPKDLYWCL